LTFLGVQQFNNDRLNKKIVNEKGRAISRPCLRYPGGLNGDYLFLNFILNHTKPIRPRTRSRYVEGSGMGSEGEALKLV